ncbi:hypothetical protein HJB67_25305 [Rhizobium lentis]|uniref:hypothetical protein n=1 Tax=Rhizobium lentis TaxID=1138194 RepID=UPI001C83F7FC|nr:hypothetical protein [Rhizobium lentis]MBX5013243.1 hypothetical protein [Rhizobium lentis]
MAAPISRRRLRCSEENMSMATSRKEIPASGIGLKIETIFGKHDASFKVLQRPIARPKDARRCNRPGP